MGFTLFTEEILAQAAIVLVDAVFLVMEIAGITAQVKSVTKPRKILSGTS